MGKRLSINNHLQRSKPMFANEKYAIRRRIIAVLAVIASIFLAFVGCRPNSAPSESPEFTKQDRDNRDEKKKADQLLQGPERPTSIVQILADPKAYHGKTVRIRGFIRIEFEGDAIYLSKLDSDNSVSQNALWLSFKQATVSRQDTMKYDKKYVSIEGVFDMNDLGHGSLFQGTIQKISRIYE